MLGFVVQKRKVKSFSPVLQIIVQKPQKTLISLHPTLKDQKPEIIFYHIERTLETQVFILYF